MKKKILPRLLGRPCHNCGKRTHELTYRYLPKNQVMAIPKCKECQKWSGGGKMKDVPMNDVATDGFTRAPTVSELVDQKLKELLQEKSVQERFSGKKMVLILSSVDCVYAIREMPK